MAQFHLKKTRTHECMHYKLCQPHPFVDYVYMYIFWLVYKCSCSFCLAKMGKATRQHITIIEKAFTFAPSTGIERLISALQSVHFIVIIVFIFIFLWIIIIPPFKTINASFDKTMSYEMGSSNFFPLCVAISLRNNRLLSVLDKKRKGKNSIINAVYRLQFIFYYYIIMLKNAEKSIIYANASGSSSR